MAEKKLIAQTEAELLARKVLQDYVNACNCQNEQDIAAASGEVRG